MRISCLLALSLEAHALVHSLNLASQHGPLSITSLAHLWDVQCRWTKGSLVLNRDLEYPRGDWVLPDLLFEVAWLRARQILQRSYFSTDTLKVFVIFVVPWLAKVFRIESTVSLKCSESEARLWVVFTFWHFQETTTSNKRKPKYAKG